MQSTSDDKRDLIPESKASLVPLFGKSLFEANSDAIESAIHSGLDIMAKNLLDDDSAIIASDILENIPFLKWFTTAGKVVTTLRDRMFIKKSLAFICAFQNGEANQEAIDQRIDALAVRDDWIERELEVILATIENSNRIDKMKILAEVYRRYLNKDIDFAMFDDLCSITEKIFLGDIIQIQADFESEKSEKYASEAAKENGVGLITWVRYLDRIGRLYALGLMRISAKVGSNLQKDSDLLEYEFSSTGRKFSEILNSINFLDGKYGEVRLN